MKRIFSLILCILLMCSMTVAYAAEPITIDIQAVDYQTGKAVSKTYVENEMFRLMVDINIPRFADLKHMELIIECDGVEIDEPAMTLTTGRYYLTGIVTEQPAAICVKVKDVAFATATTAEEMYNAMQNDRTVFKSFYFYNTQNNQHVPVNVPKTGSNAMDIIIPSVILAGAAAIIISDTAKRARR